MPESTALFTPASGEAGEGAGRGAGARDPASTGEVTTRLPRRTSLLSDAGSEPGAPGSATQPSAPMLTPSNKHPVTLM
ncbi:MAG: hypothetical protein ABW321_21695 [Polyangiales bacterium]